MAKTILQETVKGSRRRGRQSKRFKDIKDWTGLKSGESTRVVEDRAGWRGIVETS